MAWTFLHIELDGTVTDITEFISARDLNFSISGSPIGQSIEMTLVGTYGWSPVAGARVEIYNGATKLFVGWINVATRNDAGPVAGILGAETYKLTVSDIYQRMRSTYIPVAGQTVDGYTYKKYELEQPPYLRRDTNPADPMLLNITPKNMLIWAIELLRDVESRKPISMDVVDDDYALIANPTTQIPDGSGGYTNFVFKGCPFVADGLSYFDLLDNICQLAGLLWRITPDLKLQTWDAQNPPVANYEIVDGDASSSRVQQKAGSSWALARDILADEDVSAIANRIRVSYVPDPEIGKAKTKTVQSTSSQAAWGIRERRISTNYRTVQMAEAIGRRALATDKDPNIRGSATVPYIAGLLPGQFIWVHRTNHAEGAGYWVRKSYLSSIQLQFEEGFDGPVWSVLEFERNIYQAPNFTPFVAPKAQTLPGDESDAVPGTPVPVVPAPEIKTPIILPKDGTTYFTTVQITSFEYGPPTFTTLRGYLKRTGPNADELQAYPEYYTLQASLIGSNTLYLSEGVFRSADATPRSWASDYRILSVIAPATVTEKPTAARLYLSVNAGINDGINEPRVSKIYMEQLNFTPRLVLDNVPNKVAGNVLTLGPFYPGEWAEGDDATLWTFAAGPRSTKPGGIFSLSPGINRIELPLEMELIDTDDPKLSPYNGRYGAFIDIHPYTKVGPPAVLGTTYDVVDKNSTTQTYVYYASNKPTASIELGYSVNVFLEHLTPRLTTTGSGQNGHIFGGSWIWDADSPGIIADSSNPATTLSLDFNIENPLELLHCYALIQVGGTEGWSGPGDDTVTRRLTGVAKGQTVFSISPAAVVDTLNVYIMNGSTWNPYGAKGINYDIVATDANGNIVSFDISRWSRWGLRPKQSIWVRYEEAA